MEEVFNKISDEIIICISKYSRGTTTISRGTVSYRTAVVVNTTKKAENILKMTRFSDAPVVIPNRISFLEIIADACHQKAQCIIEANGEYFLIEIPFIEFLTNVTDQSTLKNNVLGTPIVMVRNSKGNDVFVRENHSGISVSRRITAKNIEIGKCYTTRSDELLYLGKDDNGSHCFVEYGTSSYYIRNNYIKNYSLKGKEVRIVVYNSTYVKTNSGLYALFNLNGNNNIAFQYNDWSKNPIQVYVMGDKKDIGFAYFGNFIEKRRINFTSIKEKTIFTPEQCGYFLKNKRNSFLNAVEIDKAEVSESIIQYVIIPKQEFIDLFSGE